MDMGVSSFSDPPCPLQTQEMTDVKLKGSGKNTNRTLTIGGELTVGSAGKLKQALIDEFERTDSLRLKFSDVKKADITVIQLLCAAHKSAQKKDKQVTVSGNGFPAAIWDTANSIGMFGDVYCSASDVCLYSEEHAGTTGITTGITTEGTTEGTTGGTTE